MPAILLIEKTPEFCSECCCWDNEYGNCQAMPLIEAGKGYDQYRPPVCPLQEYDAQCPSCGGKVEITDNFCMWCGKMLKECCTNCNKKGNEDCGESSCPNYKLHRYDIEKTKVLKNLLKAHNLAQ